MREQSSVKSHQFGAPGKKRNDTGELVPNFFVHKIMLTVRVKANKAVPLLTTKKNKSQNLFKKSLTTIFLNKLY